MDSDERALFERGVRRALESDDGAGSDAAFASLGWRDALAADPPAAVSVLFELQGEANAASSALDDVLAAALGNDGGSGIGVVLPRLGHHDPPGVVMGPDITVHGIGTTGLGRRDVALVATADGGSVSVARVATEALTLRPLAGLDPALGLVEVHGTIGPGPGTRGPAEHRAGDRPHDPGTWAAAVAWGQIAVGHELVGTARTMLRLARDHAVDRVQFGRPIASFQAVRHRLADSLVAIESAEAALTAAWDGPAGTAAMAKAIAGRSARTVARHGQQVLAGIGFTAEHPFHRFVRRTLVLDHVLGSARALSLELGQQLLATRTLPDQLPL